MVANTRQANQDLKTAATSAAAMNLAKPAGKGGRKPGYGADKGTKPKKRTFAEVTKNEGNTYRADNPAKKGHGKGSHGSDREHKGDHGGRGGGKFGRGRGKGGRGGGRGDRKPSDKDNN